MSLSRDEEIFLRHWMYDEVHYGEGQGHAKRLQLRHQVSPADLAILIAATMPDPADQERAGLRRPTAEPPAWPWIGDALNNRVAEARAALSLVHPSPGQRPEVDPIEVADVTVGWVEP